MTETPDPRRSNGVLLPAALGAVLGVLISAVMFDSGPGFEAGHLLAAVPGAGGGALLARCRAH